MDLDGWIDRLIYWLNIIDGNVSPVVPCGPLQLSPLCSTSKNGAHRDMRRIRHDLVPGKLALVFAQLCTCEGCFRQIKILNASLHSEQEPSFLYTATDHLALFWPGFGRTWMTKCDLRLLSAFSTAMAQISGFHYKQQGFKLGSFIVSITMIYIYTYHSTT